jgi:hypothetical protein
VAQCSIHAAISTARASLRQSLRGANSFPYAIRQSISNFDTVGRPNQVAIPDVTIIVRNKVAGLAQWGAATPRRKELLVRDAKHNHFVAVEKICPEAQERLRALHFDETLSPSKDGEMVTMSQKELQRVKVMG